MSKRSSVLAFVLALLIGLTAPRIMAQAQPSAVDPETKAKLQRLSTELNLTDAQKQQLQPILQSEAQEIKAVKSDASLSDDQKQAKAKDIHQNYKSQISSVLTPDQQKKLATMREEAQPK
jgi:Spy/CpxP family protein refolding chaperone